MFGAQGNLAHLRGRQKSDREVVVGPKYGTGEFAGGESHKGWLATMAAAYRPLEHFTELDKLVDFLAALDDLERVLAGDRAGLRAGKVAARAHARDNLRALHALGEAPYQIDRRLALALLYLCIRCHVQRRIPQGG